jgi:pimeloyl-ACP methyl ester carboxylesterase/AcrR family transcriptional regulator
VGCSGASAASPDAAWACVADFAHPWHPAINWMKPEAGPNGQTRRRFAAVGEDTTYLEQLTYLSHSDHVMKYSALEGIEGAKSYHAQLSVTPTPEGGAALSWRAEIDATPERADDIAAGTKAIFEVGLAALAALEACPSAPAVSPYAPVKIGFRQIGLSPRLAVNIAPAGLEQTDTLCIFLHGIGGNRSNWDAQMSAMGAHVPCVALDLRGYGDSEPGPEPSTIDAYCADILTVADAFHASKIILCGLSYGAWIATSFAMRHGSRLAGLVLAGGCTGMSEASDETRIGFRQSREEPLDRGQTPADFAPGVVKIIAGPKADEAMKKALMDSMAAIPVATYRDALRCFTNPAEVFDFARISCPVLLMTGEFDRLAPVKEIRAVSVAMHAVGSTPDIQFEIIPDAGHVCNLEAPEAFNAHLLAFLERITLNTAPLSGREIRRQAKRARILAAALAEFARNGFSGASMQAIAARAGVSKPTLYQYFGQKDALLGAVLDVGKSELLAPFENTQGQPLAKILWQFSWTYADFVLRPDMLSLARLIIGEAERLPEVARDYQAKGPLKALAGIVRFLQTQKAAGMLKFDDAEMAAQHLWSLILSPTRERLMHHPNERPDRDTLARHITHGLKVFLMAYSTNAAADIATLEDVAKGDDT